MRILYVTVFLTVLTCSGFCQSRDRKAKEYFNRGSEKVIIKNYSGAIHDLSEAIRLNPGFLEAYENRGVAKYYLNDLNGAVDDYSKALEINPNDYNTYGRRGWAEFHLKDYNAAISDFTKAIEGVSKDEQYLLIRGEAKYLNRDPYDAITDFDKVIMSLYSNKNEKGKSYYWRGMIKIDIGQLESGCLDLKEAKKLDLEEAYLLLQINCH
jgi:tetratricopeptide (TPR) repeat protein